MKIMQSAIPTSSLLEKGFDVETCSMFQLGKILINDGAGGGTKETNPLVVDKITSSTGLILFAKNAETMRRGLAKIDQTQRIIGDGGLCVVAGHCSKGQVVSGAKKVGKFLQWTAGRGKQGFIHDAYNITQILASIAKATVYKNSSKKGDLHYKVKEMYANMGMGSKVTFATFKSIVGPQLKTNFSMIMVCMNKCMPLHTPEGVTVIRNIRTRMTAGELSAIAAKAFAGEGHNPFLNPFTGNMERHNDVGDI
ncbi:MAG: hypothetical protein BGN83_06090 [Rhizobium sp. 63-7]|nr:MAG: hypothetical protein BGN83_06090 [Rhizobium sp. 63-7]